MKVDTMRSIDYWLGIPLCFVSSLILIPFRRQPRSTVKNVLFIELSEMGSAILADPAMRKIRDHGNCALYFAIFEKNQPSLDLLGTVPAENIFTIRESNPFHLIVDTLRMLAWTRRQQIDTVVDLELFSRFTALLTGFSGAANRVGFYAYHNEGLYRGEMLTHRVLYNPHIHIAKNFIALVNSVLSSNREVPYSKSLVQDSEIRLTRIKPRTEDINHMLSIAGGIIGEAFDPRMRKIVLINANASELLIQRRWMPDNYVRLIRLVLSNHPETVVFLTGSPAEYEEMEHLRDRVDDLRCHNTAGRFRFDQLPLLYSISHLMVTNDSGPAHFSSVTDLKVFVLFGPETPALYGSLGNSVPIYKGLACSPCVNASNHRKTSCRDNVCLKLITPEEVYETIKPALQAKPAAQRELTDSIRPGSGFTIQ